MCKKHFGRGKKINLPVMYRGVSQYLVLMFWLSLQSRADTLWNVTQETLQTKISIKREEESFGFFVEPIAQVNP